MGMEAPSRRNEIHTSGSAKITGQHADEKPSEVRQPVAPPTEESTPVAPAEAPSSMVAENLNADEQGTDSSVKNQVKMWRKQSFKKGWP